MIRPFHEQAFARAAKFCAFRERAPKEVAARLEKWGLTASAIEEVIVRLKKENFLDEVRFARAFCHDKFEFNKWGRVKIKMAISRYQLDEDAVEEGLKLITEERYSHVLTELATKKNAALREEDPFRKKQKMAAYLVSKGFELDLVFTVLNKMSHS